MSLALCYHNGYSCNMAYRIRLNKVLAQSRRRKVKRKRKFGSGGRRRLVKTV